MMVANSNVKVMLKASRRSNKIKRKTNKWKDLQIFAKRQLKDVQVIRRRQKRKTIFWIQCNKKHKKACLKFQSIFFFVWQVAVARSCNAMRCVAVFAQLRNVYSFSVFLLFFIAAIFNNPFPLKTRKEIIVAVAGAVAT